jgi:nucleotide-binding universal stress UspA family protein
MKHILVATDFSPPAAAALREAARLADMCKGRVTLLHVIFAEKINETLLGLDALENLSRAAGEPYDSSLAMDRLRDAAHQKLAAAIDALPGKKPPIDVVVTEGRPSTTIAAYAEQHGVDLIVVGTHGRGTLGKAFLGSVADNVIRQAECPVMVVRK